MQRREAARTTLWMGAALAGVVAVAPLVASAADADHGQTIGVLALVLALAVALAGIAAGLVQPLRRWRGDRAVARYVGALVPPLASDLLSSVELGEAPVPGAADGRGRGRDRPAESAGGRRPPRGHVSSDLVDALIDNTAHAVGSLSPAALAAHRRMARPATAFAAAVALVAATWTLAPDAMAAGWHRMLAAPTPAPFGGARLSPVPLVGDLAIALDYPDYSRRPRHALPSSSGDFSAMPGTWVTLEADALIPVASAAVILDEAGASPGAGAGLGGGREPAPGDRAASEPRPAGDPAGDDDRTSDPAGDLAGHPAGVDDRAETGRATRQEFAAEVTGSRIRVRFEVRRAGVYRFLLRGPDGRRQVEATARRIEIEPDRTPVVELFAPAEELDVTRLKRIELAYVGEDDYGIAALELVWNNGGEVERRTLSLARPGAQRAQGRTFWDLAEIVLRPGVRVPYHLEITDNDSVSGPNVGRSETFYLRVFSPREKHEQLIGRQRALLENALRALGGRLVVEPTDVRAHDTLARELAELPVELGTLLATLREDELAADDLREALEAMRTELDRLARAEADILRKLAPRDAGAAEANDPANRAQLARLAASDRAIVGELEEDVILLANWIDRQELENLLALGDEMKRHEHRLRELFAEYRRTGDPQLLAEIQRELRALEQLRAELSEKRTGLAEDVLDRFVHSDAMAADREEDCLRRVRELLDAGDPGAAEKLLEQCSSALDTAAEGMERALRELRGETFSEEEQKFAQLMDELGDLALDQGAVAEQAEGIFQRYAERADELMREEARETRKQVEGTLRRLRRRLDKIPEDGLTPFSKEELAIARKRVADVETMLDDGDIAEAVAMAEQAEVGIETMVAELEAALLDEEGEPWAARTAEAARESGRALALARELVRELKARAPSPEDILRPGDRKALEELRRRQKALRARARKLMQRADKLAGDLPGQSGSAISEGTGRAEGHMGRAEGRMRARDPSGARQEARDAAEALDRALEDARGAARNRQPAGRVGLRDEPIRIPGADEYKPPEEFREDILEAMKREQAPPGFGDMVRRYYEVLIR